LTPEQAAEQAKYELLPTGKPHVSYSELRDWAACSHRHSLKYVKKVDLSRPGPQLDFGTAVHASCEDFLRTREMKPTIATDMIRAAWERNAGTDGFERVDDYVAEAEGILADVPSWFDETFPGWECVDAEHYLYERIGERPHAFKGFIDCIIRAPGPRGKILTWILDFKTTSWGWTKEKKSDPQVTAQLVLYKNFWSKKTGTDPKDVRCGFVLLKRAAKPGARCELVTTSVGDVTTGKALKVVNNMVASVRKGIALKNRESCLYCEYKETEWCT